MAKGKKWELLLVEVKNLLAESRGNLCDAVERMLTVFRDPEYLAFHGDKLDAAQAHLDTFLADFDLTYSEAELIYRYYPSREQWRTTSLRTMLAESMERRDASQRAEPGAAPKKSRAVISRKDFEKVEQQLAQEVTRNRSLADELADTRSELTRVLQENRELMRQLARAEGRIAELERIANREMAAA